MNSTNANQSANILNYYISQKTMKESILNKLEENITNVNLTSIHEDDDATDLKGEAACAGNACEINI